MASHLDLDRPNFGCSTVLRKQALTAPKRISPTTRELLRLLSLVIDPFRLFPWYETISRRSRTAYQSKSLALLGGSPFASFAEPGMNVIGSFGFPPGFVFAK